MGPKGNARCLWFRARYADQYSSIGSLLSTLEPWVMTRAPG
jgi:hypothetical protein